MRVPDSVAKLIEKKKEIYPNKSNKELLIMIIESSNSSISEMSISIEKEIERQLVFELDNDRIADFTDALRIPVILNKLVNAKNLEEVDEIIDRLDDKTLEFIREVREEDDSEK